MHKISVYKNRKGLFQWAIIMLNDIDNMFFLKLLLIYFK